VAGCDGRRADGDRRPASLRPELLRQAAEDAISPFYDRTLDSRVAAARRRWLNENTMRIVGYFRQLDKDDRDHILAAINKRLMEAR